MADVKRCPKCGLSKALDAFWKASRTRDGLQSYCKPCATAVRRVHYAQSYGGSKAERAERAKVKWATTAEERVAMRKIVLGHYGGECACCGEGRYEFLALDHINDDGAEHRRTIKRKGHGFVTWIMAHDFPDYLQVLCHNCNTAKSAYGICPHALESNIDVASGAVA